MEQKAIPRAEIGMTDFNLFGTKVFIPRGTKIKTVEDSLIFYDPNNKVEFIKIPIPTDKVLKIKGKNISLE